MGTQPTDSIVITDEELRSLTEAIQQRHGIDFSCYEPQSLKRRLARALYVFKLNTVHDLWSKILRDRAFIFPLMDEISVGLTSMFRDPVLWRRLRSLLATDWRNRRELSIWHAGCSTGEEVYTMGIVLQEANFCQRVSAFASDISNHAMATARKGEFSDRKISEYSANYKEYNTESQFSRYYKITNGAAQMDPRLISHVTFEYHNLITDPFNRTFDIIFCRNVMIYFDHVAKQNLFRKFHHALNPGGLFVIGFYDAVLPSIDPSLLRVFDLDARIFQRVD